MVCGIILECIYAADLYLILFTIGGLIFSIGSGITKKFPWNKQKESIC